ncbi:hypothetical protein GA0061100_1151 [Rhizobium hainanense]|uniref:Uncharacterized protein n=1 Tax=Rhizobium hainanense TaxID=52131 RepID=A0A1C3WBV9_9HYPH|nr:hypothetical protein [Rhizobium hainanense]SCB37433.1 hypothetical protein GA0061100_1151 [Rhizobium hainanense]
MAKQTKPFIVEIKQSRKVKVASQKPSIWGGLDLTVGSTPHSVGSRREPPASPIGDQSAKLRDKQP